MTQNTLCNSNAQGNMFLFIEYEEADSLALVLILLLLPGFIEFCS